MSDPKMRILNLCETAQGGVGIYLTLLAGMNGPNLVHHHLAPAEHAAFLGELPDLHTFARPDRGPRAVANLLRASARLIRTLDPDICVFHSTFALAALAAMRLRGDRRPAIYCPHGWAVSGVDPGSPRGRVIRAIEGRLAGLADRVLCVSRADDATAERLGYRGHRVIIENAAPAPPPDVPDDLFADQPDRLHLLFVGRLDRQKGFDILTEALRRVRRTDLTVHVVGGAVRGDGPAPDLPPAIRLQGWVAHDRLHAWYRSADALVVPSRWEGLPLVIPEALANGTPVLCAERSGMQDLITRGVTGDHFPLDPGALAALLDGLDRAALRAMRPACTAAHARRFSIGRMHAELSALFHDLAKDR